MESEIVESKEFWEQNKKADEILKRRDEKMIALYGKEGWAKKKEEDLKRLITKREEEKKSSKTAQDKSVPKIIDQALLDSRSETSNKCECKEEDTDQFKFWKPTEEDYKRLYAQEKMEREWRRRSQIIWDPISGKKMSIHRWETKYKTKKYSEYLYDQAVEGQPIPKEIYAEIKRLPYESLKPEKHQSYRWNRHAERKTPDKSQMIGSDAQKKRDSGTKYDSDKFDASNDEYVAPDPEPENKELKPVEYKGNYLGGKKAIRDTIFNKTRGSKSLQNSTTLLLYLIQHSAWEGKNDKHNTYENWYLEKGKIVASRSQEQMAADLGLSMRTIQRWLDELEKDKLIERDIEGRENVYILGEVNGDKENFFYEKK